MDKCTETGLNWEDVRDKVEQCISILLSNGTWKGYFNRALNYYKIKFTICELYSAETEVMTPLGVRKERKLLQIY